ncbi:MAG: DUF819 family protein [Planctomycetota bacterium]|jgi:uncharacterized membrane protein
MLESPVAILAVLCFNVVISEWLVRHTRFRHFGSALLVIVVTALASNFGVIPTTTQEAPIYDGIFKYVAPLSIFWLLLGVNLREVLGAGLPILTMFVIGSAGTILGVCAGMWLINGPATIGEHYQSIGGMFVGTYIGGSINFNALAIEYGIAEQGVLYTTSLASDCIMTAVWMVATIALPRLAVKFWRTPYRGASKDASGTREWQPAPRAGLDPDEESVNPTGLGLLAAAGLAALLVSDGLAAWSRSVGVNVPSIIYLTTIALILAQVPAVTRMRGARLLGMFSVYLFLAVIGALCDVVAVSGLGNLGLTMLLFTAVVVAVHGIMTIGIGAAMRIDPDIVAVASQANIGGGTSALALARSLNRIDLVLPAILVGSLGNAIGTYFGVLVAAYIL